MLYAWMGFLKPGGGPIPQEVQLQTSEFLSQPFIRFAGPLRDGSGTQVGAMVIFEVDGFDEAETFVSESPYLQAGLYEDFRLYEYANEVG